MQLKSWKIYTYKQNIYSAYVVHLVGPTWLHSYHWRLECWIDGNMDKVLAKNQPH